MSLAGFDLGVLADAPDLLAGVDVLDPVEDLPLPRSFAGFGHDFGGEWSSGFGDSGEGGLPLRAGFGDGLLRRLVFGEGGAEGSRGFLQTVCHRWHGLTPRVATSTMRVGHIP